MSPSHHHVVSGGHLLSTKRWLPNLRSLRTCLNNCFSTLLVFRITCFAATENFTWNRVRGCTWWWRIRANLKDWNCGWYITVKARPSWRNGPKEEQNDYFSSFSPLSRRRKGFGSLLLAFPGLYAWLALLIASDADENICLLHNTRNSVPPFVYASNATATRSYPLAIALRFFLLKLLTFRN